MASDFTSVPTNTDLESWLMADPQGHALAEVHSTMSYLPTAFWLALTLPVVVACYLLKRRRKTELVPASLLWNRFLAENQANAPFQKLKRHTLLILQLCMLLLAILALSAPFFRTHRFASEMLIVLIDTSASMQSTDVAPSRMHQAHEAVEELIATMDGNDQMMLIAAGNPTRVIQSATSSHADLRRALKHLQSTDTATRLSEGLKWPRPLPKNRPCANPSLYRWSCR